ncbi:MAG TPA: glycosyltransferase [Candidatus Angelobacter sp.]|jgi:glycosyltransferase involved in cell wall biosynthesis|nr:glycosyltransferase [Candidatus Angelobacter sp.]
MTIGKTISIAMATYNGEKFLRDQLGSLSRQRHLPDELVVTDDCSTDQTLKVLTEFQASAPFAVRISVNERRLGYAENFLRAASQCKGDLIAFCDQDDVWMENKLERCLREFESPALYLIAHSMLEVDSDLKTIRHSPAIRKSCTVSQGNETPGLRWSLGCAEVMRREVIQELLACWPAEHEQCAARFNLKLLGHDEIAYFLANGMGDIRFLAEPLIRYRVHGSNVTNLLPTLGQRLMFSAGVGRDAYEKTARFLQMHGRLIKQMADASRDPCVSSVFRREAKKFMLGAGASKIRAKIYGERSRLGRLMLIVKASRRGLYGPSFRFSGMRSIAKDLAVTLLRRETKGEGKAC